MSDQDKLDEYALFDADRAFLESQRKGEPKSKSVRVAIKAYLDGVSNQNVIIFKGMSDE